MRSARGRAASYARTRAPNSHTTARAGPPTDPFPGVRVRSSEPYSHCCSESAHPYAERRHRHTGGGRCFRSTLPDVISGTYCDAVSGVRTGGESHGHRDSDGDPDSETDPNAEPNADAGDPA